MFILKIFEGNLEIKPIHVDCERPLIKFVEEICICSIRIIIEKFWT